MTLPPPLPPAVLARAILSREERCGLTFTDCLWFSLGVPGFVAEFDRLCGCDLGRSGSAIARMIDDATGFTDDALGAFAAFVHEFVWLRLVPAAGQKEAAQ